MADLDSAAVERPCRHRRILESGPAGRFCAECGERIEVSTASECGAFHERARAVCTRPEGHDGDHANRHGYWMPREGEFDDR